MGAERDGSAVPTAFLEALPKCEHHLHIEGTLEPALLFELARRNGVQLPADDDAFRSPESLASRYTRFTSLDDFLGYYYIGMSVLRSVSDFESLASAYFSKAASQGVRHAEIFFDPQAHLSRGVQYATIMAGFQKAKERAEREHGLTSLFICCFLRHLPPADSLAVFDSEEVQASIAKGEITGVGLDSSELPFPPALFQELFEKAGNANLRRTAHAGEEGPVGYIDEALSTLGISRIDHGLHLADDTALMSRVAREEILLTLCPISNVLLRCVPSVAALPIPALLAARVRFSINSDDPAYFGGNYILENYVAVQDAFHLSLADWSFICRGAIDASWCDAQRKGELLHLLDDVLARWS